MASRCDAVCHCSILHALPWSRINVPYFAMCHRCHYSYSIVNHAYQKSTAYKPLEKNYFISTRAILLTRDKMQFCCTNSNPNLRINVVYNIFDRIQSGNMWCKIACTLQTTKAHSIIRKKRRQKITAVAAANVSLSFTSLNSLLFTVFHTPKSYPVTLNHEENFQFNFI